MRFFPLINANGEMDPGSPINCVSVNRLWSYLSRSTTLRTADMARDFCLYYFMNMQRLLICCCLLAATVRSTKDFAQADRDHEMVRISKDNDQDNHHDHQPSAVDTRIIGGREISNSKLGGYIVAMYFHSSFKCGGSLIKYDIVLTAAHCFSRRVNKEAWNIYGGLSSLYAWGSQHRKIKDVVRHWKYRDGEFDWDVAVVRLNSPMGGWYVKTIPLCTTKLWDGANVVVAGWGKTSHTAWWHESYLHAVTVPIINRHRCQQLYGSTDVHLTATMFCAGVIGSKDSCFGDSGGPLAYNGQVCGIVSFGIQCGSNRNPGVYTNVYVAKSFIEQTMQELLSRS